MTSTTYRCGDVEIDAANRRFTRAGNEITLEPKLFAVLLQLLAKPGMLLTRNEMLDSVWGHRYVTASTLNRLIALARRAFGDDPNQPRFIQTVYGAGYRYIGPITVTETATTERPARFAPPAIARVPARIEALIGRESELAQLAALFASHRAVTLLGTGGLGKTQCALESARRMETQFTDGVWFFDLVPMREGDEWLQALAATLSIPPAPRSELLKKISPLLQGRRALFVIDNCDRIAAEIGTIVIEILQATDELKVLATSQTPLNFKGEQLMRLPPLAFPTLDEAGEMSTESLAQSPAVQMLLTRIQSVQPGFAINAANGATIAQICHRLDGMPLALELAAARFTLLSPQQVLQRLDQRFRFLSGSVAGRESRHQSLLAMLDWSFSLLSADEQRLLSWFSIFVQGWTVDSAIELASSLYHDSEATVDLLMGLVNKSLVSVAQCLTPPRYSLLESVRDYALARLRAAAEEERARDAHLALVVRLAKSAHQDMVNGRLRAAMDRLTHEHGNIVSSLNRGLACESGRTAALSIVGSLMLYIKASNLFSLSEPCRRVVESIIDSQSADLARAQLCVGVTAMHQLIKPLAVSYLTAAARGAQLHQDHWVEAYANGYHALWLADSGRPQDATMPAAVTRRLAEQTGDPLLIGLAGLAEGWILIAQGDIAAAVPVLVAARDLGQEPFQRRFIQTYIALAQFGLGNFSAAAAEWADLIRVFEGLGNARGMASAVEGCGYIASRMRDDVDAARFMAVAQNIRERMKLPLFNFWTSYRDAAQRSVRERLGQDKYDGCMAAVKAIREEDVFTEVSVRLSQYASGLDARPPI